MEQRAGLDHHIEDGCCVDSVAAVRWCCAGAVGDRRERTIVPLGCTSPRGCLTPCLSSDTPRGGQNFTLPRAARRWRSFLRNFTEYLNLSMARIPMPDSVQDMKGAFALHPESAHPDEPKPDGPLGPAPAYLSKEEKVVWRELAKNLIPGVAFHSDRLPFEA